MTGEGDDHVITLSSYATRSLRNITECSSPYHLDLLCVPNKATTQSGYNLSLSFRTSLIYCVVALQRSRLKSAVNETSNLSKSQLAEKDHKQRFITIKSPVKLRCYSLLLHLYVRLCVSFKDIIVKIVKQANLGVTNVVKSKVHSEP